MISFADFKGADGAVDWPRYHAARRAERAAEVAAGQWCSRCGHYLLFAKGHPDKCLSCKRLDEPAECQHSKFIRCPACGRTFDPSEQDYYGLYADGEHRRLRARGRRGRRRRTTYTVGNRRNRPGKTRRAHLQAIGAIAMSYEYRPVFRIPEEEGPFGEASSLRLRSALAQLHLLAGQMLTRLDFDAMLHNLRGEVHDAAAIESELETTYPSERSPELQQAARGLAKAKDAVRLTEAAAAFVRVYDEVARK